MILRYDHLSRFPKVFQAMPGLRLAEFDACLDDLVPRFGVAETQRLTHAARQQAIGGGQVRTNDRW